jgi:transcriptional regulator with XRE-family HTH domain
MLTGAQLRSARAALRWSVQSLAERSGVSIQTIKRFEATDGIPRSRSATLLSLKSALEAAGIEFVGAPNDRPGIRFSLPGEPTAASPQRQRQNRDRR